MFTLLKSRLKIPASFDRWGKVDVFTSSELLHQGPPVGDIRTLKQWIDNYESWRSCYDVFVKAAGTFDSDGPTDHFDLRQYEHYAALLLQSGQWRAMLLMLLEKVPDPERSRYLSEIDSILTDLRKKLADHNHVA